MSDQITREETVYKIYPEVKFSDRFSKREFVLEVNSNGKDGMVYKDFLKLEASNTWISNVNTLSVGDKVAVSFTIGGKAWTPKDGGEEKYFTHLKCWDTKILDRSSEASNFSNEPNDEEEEDLSLTDDSDLPF
jgi:hypothetical protein